MEQLGKIERLALAQALYKVAGQLVDTKNPESLRSEVDRYFKAQYDQTGSKSFDVKINDEVVGVYSIKFSKEKPSETRRIMEVTDYIALSKWAASLTAEELLGYFGRDLQPLAEWWFAETGELADGCGLAEIVAIAQPKQYIGGSLKVYPDRFAQALGNQLPNGVAGLLGGSHE